MADLPTSFWGGYIAVITLVSFAAFVWLVVDVYFSEDDDHELASQTWDHTLREGTSPAPLWWFWLLFALLIVSVFYLMLYPGIGTFSGALRWSQGGEFADSHADYADEFGERRERIVEVTVEELLDEPRVIEAGASVFAVNCAACHGQAATGQADLFPNLLDQHWQWGDSPEAISTTIRSGRTAIMPPLEATLGEAGVTAMAEYVLALGEGRADSAQFDGARARYAETCFACHGADATGNPVLGAPDLTAGIYVYGGGLDAIRATIAAGRQGQMPAFGGRLDETQIKLLTVWLRSRAASP
jgi:cytochrome c oxidase cbb3-type subunit 3